MFRSAGFPTPPEQPQVNCSDTGQGPPRRSLTLPGSAEHFNLRLRAQEACRQALSRAERPGGKPGPFLLPAPVQREHEGKP